MDRLSPWAGHPLSTMLGWLGVGTFALYAHFAENPPSSWAQSHFCLKLMSSLKPCSGWLWLILEGFIWFSISHSVTQLNSWLQYLCDLVREKAHHCCPHLQSIHAARFMGTVLCHSVYTEKMKPKVLASVNEIPWKSSGTWWNVRMILVLQEVLFALSFRTGSWEWTLMQHLSCPEHQTPNSHCSLLEQTLYVQCKETSTHSLRVCLTASMYVCRWIFSSH